MEEAVASDQLGIVSVFIRDRPSKPDGTYEPDGQSAVGDDDGAAATIPIGRNRGEKFATGRIATRQIGRLRGSSVTISCHAVSNSHISE
jgi:hypothetical protein